MRPLLVIVLALVVLPAAVASSSRKAHVTVTDTSPFVVHGTRFRAHERVTVTVNAEGRHVHRFRASAAGTFTTSFSSVTLDRCTGYAVQVAGNLGSTASLKLLPECAPPEQPPDTPLYPTDPVPKRP
jgi:hypothetical protein